MASKRVTLVEIEQKDFATVKNGYDPQQVDEFLDDIYDTMEQLEQDVKKLQDQIQVERQRQEYRAVQRPAQETKPAASQVQDSDIREILELAQKLKRETVAAAEEKATAIKENAEKEAAATLGNIQQEKSNLERQLTELKKAAADYRTKFETLLQSQQDVLDKADGLF